MTYLSTYSSPYTLMSGEALGRHYGVTAVGTQGGIHLWVATPLGRMREARGVFGSEFACARRTPPPGLGSRGAPGAIVDFETRQRRFFGGEKPRRVRGEAVVVANA